MTDFGSSLADAWDKFVSVIGFERLLGDGRDKRLEWYWWTFLIQLDTEHFRNYLHTLLLLCHLFSC